MKSRAVSLTTIVLVLLLVTFLSSSPAAGQPATVKSATGTSTARDKAAGDVAPTPSLMFIENVGQFAEGARFKVHGADRAFWLADDVLWITIMEPAPPADIRDRFASDALMQPAEQPETPRRGVNLRLTFPGSNPDVELTAYQPVDTTISYFLGDDPEKWRPDVPVWAGVQYRDLYPGLDLVWDSAGERPGLRLICRATHCAAALADVQLRVEGADTLALEGDGLLIKTAAGDFRLPLLAVADAAGRPLRLGELTPELRGQSIAAPFVISMSSASGAANPTAPTNDPSDLLTSTFLGGSGFDKANSVAVDGEDNVTVTGLTGSDDFPTTPGAFDATWAGDVDVFVSRLNSAGDRLLYSTFLGGDGTDRANSIALGPAGDTVIAGATNSAQFPTSPGAYDASHNGQYDAFASRLNATGSALLYSTFLGGSELDRCQDLALDAAGNAVLTGLTYSANFPVTPYALDAGYSGSYDVFVSRLNAAGSALLYSTYLGGKDIDIANGLAVDADGAIALTGLTESADFPATPGAYDITYNGERDAFVSLLNSAGDALLYSTFLGGGFQDEGRAVTLDLAGRAIIAGNTQSRDFPTTPGAFDNDYLGSDIFIARLNGAGSALSYSTFLGGEDYDSASSLALDDAGNVVLTGYTGSSEFPTTAGAYDISRNGGSDVFVTQLKADGGSLLYSTFLGQLDHEGASSLALDGEGNVVITGDTYSPYFPTTFGAYDTSFNGYNDPFIARLSLNPSLDARRVFLPLVRR